MVAVPSTFSTLPRASSLLVKAPRSQVLSHELNQKIISLNNTYLSLQNLKLSLFTNIDTLLLQFPCLNFTFNSLLQVHSKKIYMFDQSPINLTFLEILKCHYFLAVENSSAKVSGIT